MSNEEIRKEENFTGENMQSSETGELQCINECETIIQTKVTETM